jgi:hypothetical protein
MRAAVTYVNFIMLICAFLEQINLVEFRRLKKLYF